MSKTAPSGSNVVVETKTSRYPRYVFGVLFAISFLNYLDRFVFTGAANVIAKELNLSIDEVGYVTSAFLVVYTFATIPLGLWADKAQRKNIVALCIAIWSVATAFSAFATNFLTLFFARMLLGIGEAGYFPAGTALLSDYFNRTSRARIMSRWSIAQFIGILGGFGIGGALAGSYFGGWRLAFLITGIPGLFLAFLAWRLREPRLNQADEELGTEEATQSSVPIEKEIPQTSTISYRQTNIWQQCLLLLHIKTLRVLIAMQVFAFFVLGVCTAFLPIYLQQKDTFSLTSGEAGLYSGAVIVIAGLVGTTIGGFAADALSQRYSGARVIVCGISFLLGAPMFVLAITSKNLIVFTICFFITAMLLAVFNGPSTAASQDVAPSWLRASSMAIALLIAHLFGDAFAPSLVGVLAKVFDPTHGQHFSQDIAGQELALALLITCTPAFIIAGLIGLFGSRWMQNDVESAARADRERQTILNG